MAIYLFRLIRGKVREHKAQKEIPTTEDSHLVPEYDAKQKQRKTHGGSDSTTSTHNHVDPVTAEEAARDKAEARRRTIRQWKLMLGLALPNFLAAVDVTIVAPAIPLISSHFSTPPPRSCNSIIVMN